MRKQNMKKLIISALLLVLGAVALFYLYLLVTAWF